MNKLYYLGEPGDGYGWGVANTNLIRELSKHCDLETASRRQVKFDAPVFVPIDRGDLKATVNWEAPKVIGYCFTEWPLPENSKKNAKAYDLIFCGSTWNTHKLRNAGIKHVDTLIQGIDHEIFYPRPPSERKGFVVFSGGKYEFRKGQDYVLAAMRLFMNMHSDVVLMTQWENGWVPSIMSMKQSWLIDFDDPTCGLPEDRIVMLPPVPNKKTPDIYAQAHIGLFPNRCEAGTDLVMCEFMACGRPVIASYAHGHKDVFWDTYDPLLKTGSYDPAGWFNPEVCDIVAQLEWAYANKNDLTQLGLDCDKMTDKLTWDSCAKKILQAAYPACL